jgi:hypothetical protein
MKFLAEVSLCTAHEKRVGYRPTIKYSEFDESEIFCVEVTGMEGATWEFYCYVEQSVDRVHRHRLNPGVKFTIQEGPHVMGDGVVISVTEKRD